MEENPSFLVILKLFAKGWGHWCWQSRSGRETRTSTTPVTTLSLPTPWLSCSYSSCSVEWALQCCPVYRTLTLISSPQRGHPGHWGTRSLTVPAPSTLSPWGSYTDSSFISTVTTPGNVTRTLWLIIKYLLKFPVETNFPELTVSSRNSR